jgi:hypothetical protein
VQQLRWLAADLNLLPLCPCTLHLLYLSPPPPLPLSTISSASLLHLLCLSPHLLWGSPLHLYYSASATSILRYLGQAVSDGTQTCCELKGPMVKGRELAGLEPIADETGQ